MIISAGNLDAKEHSKLGILGTLGRQSRSIQSFGNATRDLETETARKANQFDST
jgi:hypothetical protein